MIKRIEFHELGALRAIEFTENTTQEEAYDIIRKFGIHVGHSGTDTDGVVFGGLRGIGSFFRDQPSGFTDARGNPIRATENPGD